jgi:hypothetical protein
MDLRWFLTSLPGGNRTLEPPDPIPNSEVKRCIANDSVGFPHVKVGHCQAFKSKTSGPSGSGVFYFIVLSDLRESRVSPLNKSQFPGFYRANARSLWRRAGPLPGFNTENPNLLRGWGFLLLSRNL